MFSRIRDVIVDRATDLDDLIRKEYVDRGLGRQAAIVGGTTLGIGSLGMAANGLQDDSNGTVILNPITQAAILGGTGGYLAHELTGVHQAGGISNYLNGTEGNELDKRAVTSEANAPKVRRDGGDPMMRRNKNAVYGAGAGMLIGLLQQLQDRPQVGDIGY